MSETPKNPKAKRHWGDDDSQTNIVHIDMDSFYAQVELQLHPQLRGRPVIVAGNSARGVVTSATYEARALGVRAGMPTAQARSLVPGAAIVGSHHRVYQEFSSRVMDVISRVSPVVEQISIDEAFIDVSGSRRRLGRPVEIAQDLRRAIRKQTGLPASVGISGVKSVAKIASAHAKPDGLLLIPRNRTIDFLQSLPVGSLWGVGPTMQEKLRTAGVDTVAELAHLPLDRLTRLVGHANAHHVHQLAWGIDPRPVAPRQQEKSISTERTFERDLREARDIEAFILEASHECAARLRSLDIMAWTVAIKVRDTERKTVTRSVTLAAPTDQGHTIAREAKGLIRSYGVPRGGVRLLGVRVEGLHRRSDGVPMALDEDEHSGEAEKAMDAIHARFGRGALKPATLVKKAGEG